MGFRPLKVTTFFEKGAKTRFGPVLRGAIAPIAPCILY